jgi:hypothetical protein
MAARNNRMSIPVREKRSFRFWINVSPRQNG